MVFKGATSRPGHHMVSSTHALLKYLVIYMNGKQGSGPDRGRSPVEWGDFPFVRSFVRPSVHPSVPPLEGPRASQAGLRPIQPGLRASQAGLRASEAWLTGSEACLAGSEA